MEPPNRTTESPDASRDVLEARLKLVLSAVQMETWDYDLVSGKLEFSHRWAELKGYAPDEMPVTADSWLAHVHPDDQSRVQSNIGRVLRGESAEFNSEHRVRHKDGHWVWVLGKGRVIASDSNGLPLRVVGLSLDISEQRRQIAEKEQYRQQYEDLLAQRWAALEVDLIQSEQRFRTLIELAPDPVVVHRDGIILYLNPAALKGLGATSAEQVVGKTVLSMVHPEFHPVVLQRIEQSNINREALPVIQEVLLRLDGTPLIAELQSVPIVFDQQPAMLMTIRDISKRKRYETELVEAKKTAENASLAKSRFLAAASHDLRQPIQAIKLFSSALERSELSHEQRRITKHLAESVSGLSALLESLLDLSKLDGGAVSVHHETVDPAKFFQTITLDYAQIAQAKGLRFMLFRPSGRLALNTDPVLLMQLLRNLIDNAIKYTNKGGVLIGLRRVGTGARFQVWDSGIGIAEKHLPDIFDEYFQVGNSERDNLKGLGLGLSIVQRLAKLLGTAVWCRSRLGRGTVFEFDLPCAYLAEIAPTDARNDPPAEANNFHGRLTALIEDNFMVAEALKLSFEAIGSRVLAYSSAEDALADPRCITADFLVSDLRLRGMNGLQLLEALAQAKRGPLCAVLLTGDTSPERVALTQSSVWPVLFKPTHFDDLVAALLTQTPAS